MIQSITGRALGVTAALAAVVALAQPASAQSYERLLAGIRLNSPASAVLAKFGNPNEVVIGEIGVRGAPNAAAAAANNAAAAQGGAAGGFPGGGGGLPGLGGGGRGRGGLAGAEGGGGGFPGGGGNPFQGGGNPFQGGGGGFPGAPGGFGGGGRGGDDDGPGGGGFPGGGPPAGFGGGQGGFPGGGFGGGRGGGGGAGAGQFGLTQSPVTLQQEVTWIYYRKFNNNQVAYEFLIGPSGNISQIRVSGYSGGNIFTRRGIGLGSTYRTVVRAYGYPEDHQQVGRILVTSYRNKAHISFQFLNERSATNALDSGNKVIAITIATVE